MPLSPKALDALAQLYISRKGICAAAQIDLDEIRERLLAAVEKDGHTPARAIKSKALLGDEFELRVSYPAEVTVDTAAAERLVAACARAGAGRLWKKLFRRVSTFTLAGGAQKTINAKLPLSAPRNLRALFARAVSVRELAPQIEVRERNAKSKETAA